MDRADVCALSAACAALFVLGGCVARPKPDYGAYRAHLPKSVLVLPPINQSVDVKATYSYLSTISQPLAESGYYVFPVAVVDAFMKENGLATADEMQAVPLSQIAKVFGADAVFYVTIEDYGQKYLVVSSNTVVKAHATLVDVASGATLWQGTEDVVQESGGGDLIGMLVAAAVTQVINSTDDSARALLFSANGQMIFNADSGLLLGPYSPGYEADVRGR